MTAVVAAGVGALVAGSPAALTVLTVVGGLYLMWHGVMTLRRAPAPITSDRRDIVSGRSTLVKGIGVSGLNPKGLLLFVALLPQFTSSRWSWPVAVQIAILGLTFTLSCASFYFCLGTFARVVLRARPSVARFLGRASAVAMIVIGAVLLIDRLVT
jgi:threonine/homoserine/homoserine lactone efflux protein